MDDLVLLQSYVEHGSERAFADLVERHLPFVHATALRLVGDRHTAQDVAQTVFILLARKPRSVRGNALPGWLYRAVHHAARNALRSGSRRRQREIEAMRLAEQHIDSPEHAQQIEAALDAALSCLSRAEQDAVLLHYYQGKSYRQIAMSLGLNDSAAHKRVERSLEKIRRFFANRGVTTTAALLGSAVSCQAVAPLPAGLAIKVTSASLAGTGGNLMGPLLKAFFTTMKIKIAVLAVSAISVVALVVSQHREIAQLQRQVRVPPAPAQPVASEAIVPSSEPAPAPEAAAGSAAAPATSTSVQTTMAEWKGVLGQRRRLSSSEHAALLAFLDSLDDQGFANALTYIDRNAGTTPGNTRNDWFDTLFRHWAAKNPVAAINFAQTTGDQTGLNAALTTWEKNDPAAESAWVAQQLPNSALVSLAFNGSLDYKDPAIPMKLIALGVDPTRVFGDWAHKYPSTAFNEALSLPSGSIRQKALQAVLSELDPATALNAAASLKDTAEQSAALESIVPRMDPAQAISYIGSFPTPTVAAADEKMNIAARFTESWTTRDPNAAGQWIQSLQTGTDLQQTALMNYIDTLMDASPQTVAPLVYGVNDPPTRDLQITHIAHAWLKTDPQEATAWLAQTSLPADRKQQLLNSINAGQ